MADSEYVSKAKTIKITATSRMSIKVKDNYFTIEFSEERSIPDVEGVDLAKEKEALWDAVNNEVDNQGALIVETFSK